MEESAAKRRRVAAQHETDAAQLQARMQAAIAAAGAGA
jgi:hypothetical protein